MKPYLFALGAFLAAWQIDNFDMSPRSILGAVTAALLGALNPTKPSIGDVESTS